MKALTIVFVFVMYPFTIHLVSSSIAPERGSHTSLGFGVHLCSTVERQGGPGLAKMSSKIVLLSTAIGGAERIVTCCDEF
jgi:hypothetical protein